jgi:hypothetical protein
LAHLSIQHCDSFILKLLCSQVATLSKIVSHYYFLQVTFEEEETNHPFALPYLRY